MKHLILVLSIVFGIVTESIAQNIPTYIPANGLVGWWPFNGNANDESGNTNNGIANGAILSSDRNGNSNSAYSFDGIDDRIEIAHNDTLNCSQVSISIWFKANSYVASNSYGPHLLSKRQASGWGDSFQMNIGINQGQNACWADWSIGGNGGIYYNNSSSLDTLNWYNLIYTHDSSEVKLYLNGFQVSSISSPGLLSFNNLPLWFGARPNAGGNSAWFSGSLDDIGIWNRALSQQEISDIYNSQSVNLNEIENDPFISIYPNPVNNLLHFVFNVEQNINRYEIFDITGKLVLTGAYKSKTADVMIDNLNDGLYILYINKKNKSKFMVCRK